jgi:glycosyltransferase involved in cell wall biosynthesis
MSDHKTISFIIPTIGRESLKRTVNSITPWDGDEVLVIQHNPPSGNWGNAERQEGMDKAKCDYLAFIDDDDVYVPGARAIMDDAIRHNPNNYPIIFKMQYPNGRILWKEKKNRCGNIGAPMVLVPNDKYNLHYWRQNESAADFQFVNNWKWPHRLTIWRDEVIALLGHNDEKYEEKLNFAQANAKGYKLPDSNRNKINK